MELPQTKTYDEMTADERAERSARRTATNKQIMADQATNAKRDDKALAKERAWLRRNGKA